MHLRRLAERAGDDPDLLAACGLIRGTSSTCSASCATTSWASTASA
ncbi:hypothetical protein G7085_04635 [Tessaracoccus sp. HDW20]|nr:hypothetical protein [Tessaracoccus coleopterorum]NHB84151.1 hypothetical protein [Tessaracoccus coleopterorum]